MLKISIHGIGNFGFALLKHLSRKNETAKTFDLYAYDINKKLVNHLRETRKHLFLHKNIKIDKKVHFVDKKKELIENVDILILAVPSQNIEEVLMNSKAFIKKKLIILNTAKALHAKTGERFSNIIFNCLKDIGYPFSIAMMAGGTIASDLFKHEPLGVDIASEDKEALKLLKDIFTTDNLNVYTTTDIKGVEYASAFKNVIAILSGMIEGLGYSYGSQTHMISRVAGEVKKLAVAILGAKKSTFSIESQCWGNDMWMSCTGNTRNREFGILLGKGYSTKKAIEKMRIQNKTVEGLNTVKVIKKLIKGKENEFPILFNINEIVYKEINAKKAILALMKLNKI